MYGIADAAGILIWKGKEEPYQKEDIIYLNDKPFEGGWFVIGEKELPDEAEELKWYLVVGKLVPIPAPKPTADELLDVLMESSDQLKFASQLRKAVEMMAQTLDLDNDRLHEIAELYPEWKADALYSEGTVVRYGGELYRVSEAHQSIEKTIPDKDNKLYAPVQRKRE